MGIQINGNTDNISATDGGLTVSDLEINQSGISTFNGNIDANGDLDVDGHTDLDNVSVAGVTTITGTGTNGLLKVERASGAGLHIQAQSALGVFGTTSNHNLRLISNGNERILLSTNGNIGINDSSPDTRLSVTAASGTDVVGKFTSTDARAWIQLRDNSTTDTGVMLGAEGDDMLLRAGSNTRLRITSAGYLNIGTDLTNSTYLVSSRGVGHNRVEIMSTDNNSAGIYLRTFNSGSQVSSATVRTDNSGNLQFYTAAGGSEGERLRITSGGDTTINGDLTVSSGTSGDAKLIIEADTDNNDEGDNPTLVFKQDGGLEVSSIGHGLLSGDQNGLVLANSCSNGYMSFATGSTNGHTNATEKLRIDASGTIQCGTSGVLQAFINNSVSGHQFISQCDPNQNGFEIYQKHGSTTIRNTLAVYANTGSSGAKQLQFAVRGDGNIIKPSHCCFQAVINSGTHPTSGSYLVFGAVDVNIGNHYNSSNGIFTAPVAGVYLFHISAIAHNNTTTVYRYFLRINNGNTGSGNDAHLRLDMTNDDNDYGPNASYTYYKYMNANDTARVYWYTDIGSGTSYSNADYMKFAGHLVG